MFIDTIGLEISLLAATGLLASALFRLYLAAGVQARRQPVPIHLKRSARS